MSLAISEATAADAATLSEFSTMTYVAAFGADFDDRSDLHHHLETTLSADAWRRYLATDRVFVAQMLGRPVGYLQLAAESRHLEIRRLYVDPARQGQGIGALLMRQVLNDPAVSEAPLVRLNVWQDNLRAQKFYGRFGFEMTPERKPFVLKSGKIDGYDLVMVRRRPPA